jgi:hypothetical protein
VSTYPYSNTAKDDLDFELLLCLTRILGVIERMEPTGAIETQSRDVYVPMQPKSNPTADNLEFEWLLCLASALDAIRHRWPTGIGEIHGAEGYGDTKDGEFFEGESKKVLNFTRGKWQMRSQESASSSTD